MVKYMGDKTCHILNDKKTAASISSSASHGLSQIDNYWTHTNYETEYIDFTEENTFMSKIIVQQSYKGKGGKSFNMFVPKWKIGDIVTVGLRKDNSRNGHSVSIDYDGKDCDVAKINPKSPKPPPTYQVIDIDPNITIIGGGDMQDRMGVISPNYQSAIKDYDRNFRYIKYKYGDIIINAEDISDLTTFWRSVNRQRQVLSLPQLPITPYKVTLRPIKGENIKKTISAGIKKPQCVYKGIESPGHNRDHLIRCGGNYNNNEKQVEYSKIKNKCSDLGILWESGAWNSSHPSDKIIGIKARDLDKNNCNIVNESIKLGNKYGLDTLNVQKTDYNKFFGPQISNNTITSTSLKKGYNHPIANVWPQGNITVASKTIRLVNNCQVKYKVKTAAQLYRESKARYETIKKDNILYGYGEEFYIPLKKRMIRVSGSISNDSKVAPTLDQWIEAKNKKFPKKGNANWDGNKMSDFMGYMDPQYIEVIDGIVTMNDGEGVKCNNTYPSGVKKPGSYFLSGKRPSHDLTMFAWQMKNKNDLTKELTEADVKKRATNNKPGTSSLYLHNLKGNPYKTYMDKRAKCQTEIEKERQSNKKKSWDFLKYKGKPILSAQTCINLDQIPLERKDSNGRWISMPTKQQRINSSSLTHAPPLYSPTPVVFTQISGTCNEVTLPYDDGYRENDNQNPVRPRRSFYLTRPLLRKYEIVNNSNKLKYKGYILPSQCDDISGEWGNAQLSQRYTTFTTKLQTQASGKYGSTIIASGRHGSWISGSTVTGKRFILKKPQSGVSGGTLSNVTVAGKRHIQITWDAQATGTRWAPWIRQTPNPGKDIDFSCAGANSRRCDTWTPAWRPLSSDEDMIYLNAIGKPYAGWADPGFKSDITLKKIGNYIEFHFDLDQGGFGTALECASSKEPWKTCLGKGKFHAKYKFKIMRCINKKGGFPIADSVTNLKDVKKRSITYNLGDCNPQELYKNTRWKNNMKKDWKQLIEDKMNGLKLTQAYKINMINSLDKSGGLPIEEILQHPLDPNKQYANKIIWVKSPSVPSAFERVTMGTGNIADAFNVNKKVITHIDEGSLYGHYPNKIVDLHGNKVNDFKDGGYNPLLHDMIKEKSSGGYYHTSIREAIKKTSENKSLKEVCQSLKPTGNDDSESLFQRSTVTKSVNNQLKGELDLQSVCKFIPKKKGINNYCGIKKLSANPNITNVLKPENSAYPNKKCQYCDDGQTKSIIVDGNVCNTHVCKLNATHPWKNQSNCSINPLLANELSTPEGEIKYKNNPLPENENVHKCMKGSNLQGFENKNFFICQSLKPTECADISGNWGHSQFTQTGCKITAASGRYGWINGSTVKGNRLILPKDTPGVGKGGTFSNVTHAGNRHIQIKWDNYSIWRRSNSNPGNKDIDFNENVNGWMGIHTGREKTKSELNTKFINPLKTHIKQLGFNVSDNELSIDKNYGKYGFKCISNGIGIWNNQLNSPTCFKCNCPNGQSAYTMMAIGNKDDVCRFPNNNKCSSCDSGYYMEKDVGPKLKPDQKQISTKLQKQNYAKKYSHEMKYVVGGNIKDCSKDEKVHGVLSKHDNHCSNKILEYRKFQCALQSGMIFLLGGEHQGSTTPAASRPAAFNNIQGVWKYNNTKIIIKSAIRETHFNMLKMSDEKPWPDVTKSKHLTFTNIFTGEMKLSIRNISNTGKKAKYYPSIGDTPAMIKVGSGNEIYTQVSQISHGEKISFFNPAWLKYNKKSKQTEYNDNEKDNILWNLHNDISFTNNYHRRMMFPSVVYNKKIYLIGGWASNLSKNEKNYIIGNNNDALLGDVMMSDRIESTNTWDATDDISVWEPNKPDGWEPRQNLNVRKYKHGIFNRNSPIKSLENAFIQARALANCDTPTQIYIKKKWKKVSPHCKQTTTAKALFKKDDSKLHKYGKGKMNQARYLHTAEILNINGQNKLFVFGGASNGMYIKPYVSPPAFPTATKVRGLTWNNMSGVKNTIRGRDIHKLWRCSSLNLIGKKKNNKQVGGVDSKISLDVHNTTFNNISPSKLMEAVRRQWEGRIAINTIEVLNLDDPNSKWDFVRKPNIKSLKLMGITQATDTGVYGHSSVVLNNEVYILGGQHASISIPFIPIQSNNVTDLCYKFDGVNTPINIAKMKQKRYCHSSVVLNNKIYVMGGLNHSSETLLSTHICHNTVEMYDPESNTWSYVQSMKEPRFGFSATVFRKKIFVLGGASYVRIVDEKWLQPDNKGSSFPRTFDKNTVVNKLNSETKLKSRFPNGLISDGFINTIEMYDPDENSWSNMYNIKLPIFKDNLVNFSSVFFSLKNNDSNIDEFDLYDKNRSFKFRYPTWSDHPKCIMMPMETKCISECKDKEERPIRISAKENSQFTPYGGINIPNFTTDRYTFTKLDGSKEQLNKKKQETFYDNYYTDLNKWVKNKVKNDYPKQWEDVFNEGYNILNPKTYHNYVMKKGSENTDTCQSNKCQSPYIMQQNKSKKYCKCQPGKGYNKKTGKDLYLYDKTPSETPPIHVTIDNVKRDCINISGKYTEGEALDGLRQGARVTTITQKGCTITATGFGSWINGSIIKGKRIILKNHPSHPALPTPFGGTITEIGGRGHADPKKKAFRAMGVGKTTCGKRERKGFQHSKCLRWQSECHRLEDCELGWEYRTKRAYFYILIKWDPELNLKPWKKVERRQFCNSSAASVCGGNRRVDEIPYTIMALDARGRNVVSQKFWRPKPLNFPPSNERRGIFIDISSAGLTNTAVKGNDHVQLKAGAPRKNKNDFLFTSKTSGYPHNINEYCNAEGTYKVKKIFNNKILELIPLPTIPPTGYCINSNGSRKITEKCNPQHGHKTIQDNYKSINTGCYFTNIIPCKDTCKVGEVSDVSKGGVCRKCTASSQCVDISGNWVHSQFTQTGCTIKASGKRYKWISGSTVKGDRLILKAALGDMAGGTLSNVKFGNYNTIQIKWDNNQGTWTRLPGDFLTNSNPSNKEIDFFPAPTYPNINKTMCEKRCMKNDLQNVGIKKIEYYSSNNWSELDNNTNHITNSNINEHRVKAKLMPEYWFHKSPPKLDCSSGTPVISGIKECKNHPGCESGESVNICGNRGNDFTLNDMRPETIEVWNNKARRFKTLLGKGSLSAEEQSEINQLKNKLRGMIKVRYKRCKKYKPNFNYTKQNQLENIFGSEPEDIS